MYNMSFIEKTTYQLHDTACAETTYVRTLLPHTTSRHAPHDDSLGQECPLLFLCCILVEYLHVHTHVDKDVRLKSS